MGDQGDRPEGLKKLERSKDCAYVEAAYEDTILTCRKKPAEAHAEFVERENADEHIFQTKHVFVSWADGVGYRYALRDFPKLPAVLNSSKCAPDEYGLRYTCRINAPKAYRQKVERNPNSMIPSSRLRLRPDFALEAE